jgi:diguanylate cyclase (GGDEF)-like protein/PAS domain S-box-containing protein
MRKQRFTENLPVLFYLLKPSPPYSPICFSKSFETFGYPLESWHEDPKIWERVLHPDDKARILKIKSFSAQEELDCQYRITSKSGKVHYLREKGCFLRDENAEKLCWLSVIVDFTDWLEKSAQERSICQGLFDNLNDIVYISDLNGKWIEVSAAIERILGYSRKEILSELRMEDIVVSEHLSLIKERVEGKVSDTIYEIECIAKNGERVTLELNSGIIYGKDGTPYATWGVARNITERKKLIESLKNSEQETKALFSALPELVLIVNKQGQLVKVPSTRAKFFRTLNPGENLREIFSAEDSEFLMSGISDCLETGVVKKLRAILHHENKEIWYEIYLSPINKETVLMTLRDVTEEHQAMTALKESEEQYRELFENANDVIYIHDLHGNYISVNRAGELLTGYSKEEVRSLNFVDVVAPEYVEVAREQLRRKLRSGGSSSYEVDIISKDGRRISLELRTQLIYHNGKPIAVQGIGRDITQRKKIEQALRESEERYRQLAESIVHQVWTAFPDGKIEFLNKNLLDYFGCSFERVFDVWKTKVHPKDKFKLIKKALQSFRKNSSFEIEVRLLGKDGEYRWYLIRAVPGFDLEGRIVRWYGTNTDIHNQKEAEAKLRYFATHDVLTKLLNRTEFIKQLRTAINTAQNELFFKFAVLFIDLDRFKFINDNFGHEVGDEFLRVIAKRIISCVRPYDIVARFGGDEFTVLLNNVPDPADVTRVAERILRTLSEPILIKGYKIFASASIGIRLFDPSLQAPEEYLRDADIAMYQAKRKGKAGYEIFDYQMWAQVAKFLQIENELRNSLEREDFVLFYQPIVSLTGGEIVSLEALLRWNHPIKGIITPGEFIDIAEETGLIIPIGYWVLRQACYQLRDWHERFPNYKHLSVSVNLSSNQLKDPNLYSKIIELLNETGLNPSCLNVETTEKAILEGKDIAVKSLLQLRSLGIGISTDDFGTGYSSLNYLDRVPFQFLKLDLSFTRRIENDKRGKSILEAILMMEKSLDIKVIAEGIETKAQLEVLRKCGCNFGQGYLFSEPLAAEKITEILEKGIILKPKETLKLSYLCKD